MIIYIDIDNTICNTTDVSDYSKSTPIIENLRKVRKLVDRGHEVSFWTARGSVSKTDWSEVTHRQLEEWGVGDVPVIFGKPYFDLFIDDRVMNVEDWV
jgi:hypothetical protein|tara:strand:+ start:1507 stop:1800 length:294 start_codon:yes stop_codon:yes gene_type:complete